MKIIDMKQKVLEGFSNKGVSVARCYTKHKPLQFGKGVLHGGSAFNSLPGMDIYVTLETHARDIRDGWVDPPPIRLPFPIPDRGVPKEVDHYKAMVTYICNQLRKGKSVHIGCIGGHGRTGMTIAAIVAEMGVSKDAIQWTRDNYCQSAVESKAQVDFLVHEYGVKKAKAGDAKHGVGFLTQPAPYTGKWDPNKELNLQPPAWAEFPELGVMPQSFDPMPSPKNIWLEPAIDKVD